MTNAVRTVGPDATVRDIAQIMREEDTGVVPVVTDDRRLFGLVTDRDIVVRGLTDNKAITDLRARDLATRDLEVSSPADPLSEILDMMGRQQIRRVPVVDENDVLVGIVSLADVANRADHHHDLQQALERISGRRSFSNRIWR
ncbi:MAG: CBS domain-containing protein [Pseudomonadota bacterium]